jgi:hypothetical protein
MARKYTATVVLDGDSSGAVKTLKLTQGQLDKLGKATQRTNKHAGGLTKTFGSMKTQLLAMAPAIGAAGIVAIGKQALDTAKSIKLMADTTGVSVEAMSALRPMAKAINLDLQDLSDALRDQAERIAEAAVLGSGEAVEALDSLGLSAERLNEMAPDKQLEVLADAFAGLAKQGDRIRVAAQLGGDAYTKLLPILQQGGDAVRDYMQRAEDLNLVLSEDQVDAAAKAAAELGKMSMSASALAESLTMELAPALADSLGWINKLIQADDPFEKFHRDLGTLIDEMTGLAEERDKAFFTPSKADTISDQITELTNSVFAYQQAIADLDVQTDDGMRAYKAYAMQIAAIEKQIETLRGDIKGYTSDIDENVESSEKALRHLGKEGAAREKLARQEKEEEKAREKRDRERKKRDKEKEEQLKREADAWQSLVHSIDENARATDDFMRQYDALLVGLDEGRITLDRYIELTDMLATGQEDLADKTEESANRFTDVLDDAFSRVWRDGLDGLDDFGDSLVSGMKDIAARTAHELITKPMVLNIQAAVSGGGGAQGGGGIGQLFGGQQIGAGISNVGSALGTDLFAGAAGVPNWQYGIAGIGGGLAGGAIGGETGSALGSLGSTVGMALGGPWGAAIGAIAGGALGKVFSGDDTAYATWQTRRDRAGFEDDVAVQSAFGYLGMADVGSKNIKAEDYRASLEAVAAIDNLVAETFGPDTAAAIADRLDGWTEQDRKADDFAERMGRRFRIILDEVGDGFADIVDVGGDLEDMATRLVAASGIRTFAESDMLTEYADRLAMASVTMHDAMLASVDGMYDLIDGYDGSTAAMQTLSAATQQRYALEMQYLEQISNVQQSLTTMLEGSIESIQLSVMDTAERYDYYTDRAESLADALETMTDPTRIQETAQQIDQLTSRAYGLLDAEQQQQVSNEFVDFLGGVLETSQAKLKAAEQEAVNTGQILRDALLDAITSGGTRFGAQMQAAAGVLNGAATRVAGAISNLSSEIG